MTAAKHVDTISWTARLDVTTDLCDVLQEALRGPDEGDWVRRVRETAAAQGDDSLLAAINALESDELGAPVKDLPGHVAELLERLQAVQDEVDYLTLIAELNSATPKRREQINQLLSQRMREQIGRS